MFSNKGKCHMKKVVMAISVLFLALGACTKKREDSFAQGQGGPGLMVITDYDGRFFDLQTGKAVGTLYSSKSEKIIIETEKSKVINDFPLVDYKTEAKLLDNVPFRGRESSSKYKVLYKLNDTHLVVYKVGAEEDIPMQERPTAIVLDDKRLAVPMIGYPVKSFAKIEKEKNSDGETTNTLLELSAEGKKQATHFRIDLNLGELFKQVQKIDIFPTALLDGEWYYSETVISAPEKNAAEIGYTMSYDTEFQESTKIRFQKFDSAITGVNTNIDDRIKNDKDKDKEGVNSNNVVTIPVEWKAYKLAKRGDSIQMTEEEDPTIPWGRRPFMSMQLEKISSTGTVNLNMKVMDVKIADDYFSFSVFDTVTKTKTRYSFARVKNNNYKIRPYTVADSRIFGFFTSAKNHMKTVDDYSQDDLDQYLRLARFNPSPDKPIVFHFTKTTPDWIRSACAEVVRNWQQAFIEAGTEVKVLMDEKNDVDLGDIRYNAINMIETISSSDLFGVGPSLIEPASGEIISAITNVHMTSIIDQVIEELRTYVNREAGLYKGLWISGVKIPGFESLISSPEDTRYPQLGYFENEIKNKCPQVISYVSQVKGVADRSSAKDMAVLRPCARLLAVQKIQSTLVHELGHNFGLRHNFRASTDEINFLPKEKTKTPDVVQSSSVMDYPYFSADRLIMPAPYDIAAIRYGYGNKVQVTDETTGASKIVTIDETMSLKKQNLVSKLKNYKFCTDEDAPSELSADTRKIDPLCNRHDAGVTADLVVDNLIESYQRTILRYNFRMNKAQAILPQGLEIYKEEKYFKPMRFIYFKWRDYVNQYVGEDKKYLSSFDESQYKQILENMSKDKRFAKAYAEYKPAADKIFDFMLKLMSVQPKFCMARDSSQNIKYLDLSNLRIEIYRDTGVTINSCFDAEALKLMKAQNLTMEFGGGFFNQDIRFDLSEDALKELTDIYGISEDKRMAMDTLQVRHELSRIMRERTFQPSMLDEPQYRMRLVALLSDRIFNGPILRDFGIEDDRRLLKFGFDLGGGMIGEKPDLFARKFLIIKNSMLNPEDPVASAIGTQSFEIDVLSGGEDVGKEDFVIDFGTKRIRAKKENAYAYKILEKADYLMKLQAKPISEINKAGYESVRDVKAHLKMLQELSGI